MKRFLQIILVTVALAIMAAPLAAQEEDAGPTTLELWSPAQGAEAELLRSQIEAYNDSQQDVVVEVYFPDDPYLEAVDAASSLGETPDILMVPSSLVAYYAWQGAIISLDGYVGDEMRNDFLATTLSQGAYEGELYGLAAVESCLVMFANNMFMHQTLARVPEGAEDPWTNEEFHEVLMRLSRLHALDAAMDVHADQFTSTEFMNFVFHPMFAGQGGALLNPETSLAADAFNSTQSLAAFGLIADWFNAGYALAEQDEDLFIQEKAGLSFTGEWAWEPYSRALGDKLLVLPMPILGETPATTSSSWSWAVSSASDNPDQAWDCLAFLLGSTRILQTSTVTGAVPARKSAAEHSAVYGENGPLRILVVQLDSIGVARPDSPAYGLVSRIFAETLLSLAGGGDVVQTVGDATQHLDSELMRLGFAPLPEIVTE
ncbi:MAG: extracellular solute-binding protein [Desulfovibrio sp.]|nr:MAG: extracellular solute-binding protein [Desulfovibrio sp.]